MWEDGLFSFSKKMMMYKANIFLASLSERQHHILVLQNYCKN